MPIPTRLLVFLLLLGPITACVVPPTTIAVNPISGRVYSTLGNSLWSCDAAGESCTQGAIVMAPTDAAVTTDSRLVFAAGRSIHVCNDEGQACIAVDLPAAMIAEGLSVGPSGQVFVIGSKGELAACSETECRAVANRMPNKSSEPATE